MSWAEAALRPPGALGHRGGNQSFFYEHAMVLVQLDDAHRGVSPEKAERHAAHALEVARQHGERGNEAWAVHLLGRVAAARLSVNADAAAIHTTRAMRLATELEMRPLVAHCHLGLGELLRCAGKRPEACEHFTTATTMYREMDMRFWLEQAEAEMKNPAFVIAPTT